MLTRVDNACLSLDLFTSDASKEICSWVRSTREIKLISSDVVNELTPSLLQRWVDESLAGYVLRFGDELIAFATASDVEWEFPPGLCEICHLVVAPRHRQRYHGSFFVNWISRVLVGSGFDRVTGRACAHNEPALRLMSYLRWHEVSGQEAWATGPFRWFTGPARDWK